MGGFWSLFLPGLYFTLLGLWWMFCVAWYIAALWKSNGLFHTFSWFPTRRLTTIEPYVTLVFCFLCGILELASYDDSPYAEHIGIYSSLALISLIQLQQFYRKGAPAPYEFLAVMLAYILITLELYYHLKETPIGENALITQIIYLTVSAALINFLEFVCRDHPVVGMCRASIIFLIGVNFIHSAFLLYPPFEFLSWDLNSPATEKKVVMLSIIEIVSLALPLSVIIIGLVVDFYDD